VGVINRLPDNPKREEVFEFLYSSSRYGNLGLFIGAGFSMAVLNSDADGPALGWGMLLKEVAKKMKVDLEAISRTGDSYPQLASALCAEYAKIKEIEYEAAVRVLKSAICVATAWFPQNPERGRFAAYLNEMFPAWIVTSNYDQVLECLLSGKSQSLGPNDAFSWRRGAVPIIHLHGIRTASDDLIITQEDYVKLFRPADYRQIRLALSMRESALCLLGYGLGDVNVLTALDWSTHVYEREISDYPHDVIQVLRTDKPQGVPHRSKEGVVILEVSELAEFFDEYLTIARDLKEVQDDSDKTLLKIGRIFRKADESSVKKFIENDVWRRQLLEVLSAFSLDLVEHFESFLQVCFGETRRRSGKTGAFGAYATDLEITLDLLTAFSLKEFPPALLPIAAENLNRLANYIGTGKGDSWAANSIWAKRKSELKGDMASELTAIARQYGFGALRKLVHPLLAA
jgi:hypothetical protein